MVTITKPGSAGKAITYSQKVMEVANADAPDADTVAEIVSRSGALHYGMTPSFQAGQDHGRDSGTESLARRCSRDKMISNMPVPCTGWVLPTAN